MKYVAPIVASLALVIQNPVEPEETVRHKFVSQGGAVVEVVAVCKLSDTAVQCWDMAGKPAPRIQEAYEKTLAAGEYNGRVTLQYGKKNRTIIVRTQRSNSGDYLSVESNRQNSLNSSSNGLRSLSEDVPNEVNSDYHMLSMHFENDQSQTYVDTTQRLLVDSNIVIPLKSGLQFKFRDVTYTIEEPVKSESDMYGNPVMSYRFPVESSGLEPRSFSFSTAAFDKDDKAIQFVDEKGKPITREEYERRFQTRMYPGRFVPQNNAYVGIQLLDNGRDGYIQTQIDPRYISEVHITPTWVRRVRITEVPLDPSS